MFNFKGNDNNESLKYPVNAYQYNPGGMNANKYSGMIKGKRPLSASIGGRVGRNGGNEQVVGNTLTAHNSKMPTEYSKIDIKRMKPKRINQEKEKLYEQSIHYKIQMNNFKAENIKLKTRLKFLEKEQYEKE
jgi:hypothetical protein